MSGPQESSGGPLELHFAGAIEPGAYCIGIELHVAGRGSGGRGGWQVWWWLGGWVLVVVVGGWPVWWWEGGWGYGGYGGRGGW